MGSGLRSHATLPLTPGPRPPLAEDICYGLDGICRPPTADQVILAIGVRISAKADYAVRAVVELAANADEKPVKAERLATAQGIPLNFLENILGELRHAGLVRSHRGAEGGFRLAKPAEDITIADVIRAVEGPLASVRGAPPEEQTYEGASEALLRVWIAVRANLRKVVEQVTVADVASGRLPRSISNLAKDPEAWITR
jgi:Rrf2 family protein